MKIHLPRHAGQLRVLTVLLSLCAGALAAEPQTITIKDWTGRGFPPDLVNYTIEARPDGGKSLRLLGADGKPAPVQVTPGEKGKALSTSSTNSRQAGSGQATLSFVAAVPPNGSATYTLRTDGRGSAAPPAISSTKDGESMILANQSLAVRVPAPQGKAFDQPVAANTLPAPILAFRGPDGQWKGEGKLLLKRPVKRFAVAQTANGPVFCAIRYRLDYEGGGWYAATVRVADRAPHAEVREEYDLGQVAAKNVEFCSSTSPRDGTPTRPNA